MLASLGSSVTLLAVTVLVFDNAKRANSCVPLAGVCVGLGVVQLLLAIAEVVMKISAL